MTAPVCPRVKPWTWTRYTDRNGCTIAPVRLMTVPSQSIQNGRGNAGGDAREVRTAMRNMVDQRSPDP
ncbi:hypothetical protein GCM10010404_53940 [Nonomuraea africana]